MKKGMLKNVLSTIALTGMLLGTVVTPVIADPSSIIYKNTASQLVICNYLSALVNAPMKTALTSALESNELANLPIFVTDSSGKVVDYLAAINKSENYAAALLDSTVNNTIAPVANYQLNTDGTVTPVVPLSFPGETGSDYNLPDGTVGTAYTANIIATGGTPPYNYAAILPAGLTMGTDGTISGIPIQDWTIEPGSGLGLGGVTNIITVNVTDSATPTAGTASMKCALTVRPAAGSIPLTFWGVPTCQIPPVVGTPCNYSVTAIGGGTPPYSFALASGSSLPAGLTMGTDGIISGIPTVSGTTSFTLIATDSTKPTAETVSAPFNFVVVPALSLPSATLADGTIGTAYTTSISATGGTGFLPYSYALASGSSLPAGLKMGTDGTISGTPTVSGTASFTVNVTDSAMLQTDIRTASQTFRITVKQLNPAALSSPNIIINQDAT